MIWDEIILVRLAIMQKANPHFWTKGYGRTMAPENARKATTARRRKGHKAGGALRASPACDVLLAVVVFRAFSGAVVRPYPFVQQLGFAFW